jgi:ParB-like chromosome segregation protein Spo0J
VAEQKLTHIKQLKFDPRNARQHNERNITMIADGLSEVGAGRSILIDGKGEIIAGNGVVEAAAQAGITKVRVIETTGDEIVAVMRKDLVGRKKTRAALLDNRAQETSKWDTDVIKEIAEDDNELLRGLWSKEEVDALISLPSLSPLENEEEESQSPDVTDDGMQRMTLWIPREEYDGFLANIRKLSGEIDVDDVGRVVMYCVNKVATGDT